MRLRIVSLIFFSFVIISRGQLDNQFKDSFLEAQSYFLFEEYEEALPIYMKLLRNNPYNNNLKYLIGRCLLNNTYRSSQSIRYLEEASKNISSKYKEDSYKETMAPADVVFYLAEAYHKNNMLDEAINQYNMFLKNMDPDLYDMELVRKRISSCEYAKEQKDKPVKIILKHLGENINSSFEEYNPVISGDGKTMAFTRKLQFYDAIFVSYKNDTGWTPPVNIVPQLGVDGDVATSSLNYKGNALYIYNNDNYDGNIYVSIKNGEQWGKLFKLNDNINTKYWESNAFESPNSEILYFSSNRPDGYGRLDIYMSFRQRNGSWGPAINLGPEINTPYNDDAPFVIKDGKILVYSSYGHNTIGDYDYFYSINKEGIWQKPKNLGYPLNSTGEEIMLSTTNNGDLSVLSIFDPDKTYGLKDIFFTNLELSIPEIAKIDVPNQSDQGKKNNLNTDNTIRTNRRDTFSIALNNTRDNVVADTDITDSKIIVPKKDGLRENIELSPSAINDTFNNLKNLDGTMSQKKVHEGSIITKNRYDVIQGKEIEIPLVVSGIKKLEVEVSNNNTIVFERQYNLNDNNFVFKYLPEAGANTIKFIFTDKEGNSWKELVFVECIASPESNDDQIVLTSVKDGKNLVILNEIIQGLKISSANKNLINYIDSVSNYENNLDSVIKKIIRHIQNDSVSFNLRDVLAAFLKTTELKKANINDFYMLLTKSSTPALREYISGLNINEQGFTPLTLLEHLFNALPFENFSEYDLYKTLSHLLMQFGQDGLAYKTSADKIKYQNKPIIIVLVSSLALILLLIVIFRRKRKKTST